MNGSAFTSGRALFGEWSVRGQWWAESDGVVPQGEPGLRPGSVGGPVQDRSTLGSGEAGGYGDDLSPQCRGPFEPCGVPRGPHRRDEHRWITRFAMAPLGVGVVTLTVNADTRP